MTTLNFFSKNEGDKIDSGYCNPYGLTESAQGPTLPIQDTSLEEATGSSILLI
jgi:hypothetical protein